MGQCNEIPFDLDMKILEKENKAEEISGKIEILQDTLCYWRHGSITNKQLIKIWKTITKKEAK